MGSKCDHLFPYITQLYFQLAGPNTAHCSVKLCASKQTYCSFRQSAAAQQSVICMFNRLGSNPALTRRALLIPNPSNRSLKTGRGVWQQNKSIFHSMTISEITGLTRSAIWCREALKNTAEYLERPHSEPVVTVQNFLKRDKHVQACVHGQRWETFWTFHMTDIDRKFSIQPVL